MTAGLQRTAQTDFSAGMFRSVAPELIPANGAYDIENGLLDEAGIIYKRGGTGTGSGGDAPAGMWGSFLWGAGVWGGSGTGDTSAGDGPIQAVWSGYISDVFTRRVYHSSSVPQLGRVVVYKNVAYVNGNPTLAPTALQADFYAVAGGRLFLANGDKVSFTAIDATTIDPTDYHQLPEGVRVVGMQGLRDSVVVFTTSGVWVIGNVAYNLTDDSGNVQQRLDRYSQELVLWGDPSIAGWEGGIVSAARGAVWIMSLGIVSEAPQPFQQISSAISSLYRSYLDRGYTPGVAAVFRGHYLLPILNGDEVVETLVCRLDATDASGNRTFPWTRLTGRGAQVRVLFVDTETTPRLLAAADDELVAANYFDRSDTYTQDHDGSPVSFSMTTRDYQTGSLNDNTVLYLRAGYEMTEAGGTTPTINAYYASDRQSEAETGTTWGTLVWGTGTWAEGDSGPFKPLDGSAPADAYAAKPFRWRVGRKSRYARFKLAQGQATGKLSLRTLEVFVRSDGKI